MFYKQSFLTKSNEAFQISSKTSSWLTKSQGLTATKHSAWPLKDKNISALFSFVEWHSHDKLYGHCGCFWVCGDFWDRPRANPVVHSDRALRSRCTASCCRCGRLLQLDGQLSGGSVLPTFAGKNPYVFVCDHPTYFTYLLNMGQCKNRYAPCSSF